MEQKDGIAVFYSCFKTGNAYVSSFSDKGSLPSLPLGSCASAGPWGYCCVKIPQQKADHPIFRSGNVYTSRFECYFQVSIKRQAVRKPLTCVFSTMFLCLFWSGCLLKSLSVFTMERTLRAISKCFLFVCFNKTRENGSSHHWDTHVILSFMWKPGFLFILLTNQVFSSHELVDYLKTCLNITVPLHSCFYLIQFPLPIIYCGLHILSGKFSKETTCKV